MTPMYTIAAQLARAEPFASDAEARQKLEDAAEAVDAELQMLRQEVIRLSNPGSR